MKAGIFVILAFLFNLSSISSLKLTALNKTVVIQTITQTVKFEQLSYEKQERDPRSNVTLVFYLTKTKDTKENLASLKENIKLEINDEAVKVYTFSPEQLPISGGYARYIKQEIKSDKVVYSIIYRKIAEVIPGKYKLTVDKVSAVATITSPPVAETFHKLKLGLVGDPMRVTCKYNFYGRNKGDVSVKWYKLAKDVDSTKISNFTTLDNARRIDGGNSNDRVRIGEGKSTNKTNDTLYIEQLEASDIGVYVCQLSYGNYTDQAVLRINVKDRWAALYPFFGIILEVVLVVVLILVYERYQLRNQNRKQREAFNDEIDEDQVGNQNGPEDKPGVDAPLNNEDNQIDEEAERAKNNGVNESLRQRNPEC